MRILPSEHTISFQNTHSATDRCHCCSAFRVRRLLCLRLRYRSPSPPLLTASETHRLQSLSCAANRGLLLRSSATNYRLLRSPPPKLATFGASAANRRLLLPPSPPLQIAASFSTPPPLPSLLCLHCRLSDAGEEAKEKKG